MGRALFAAQDRFIRNPRDGQVPVDSLRMQNCKGNLVNKPALSQGFEILQRNSSFEQHGDVNVGVKKLMAFLITNNGFKAL